MDRKAALATAAGLVLVVAGAASALSSTWTQPTPTTVPATATVITEYVDEAGNPVAPPADVQAETVIFTRSPAAEEIVVFEDPQTIFVDVPATAGATGGTSTAGFDDDDHEDEDQHADEDEHDGSDEDEHADEDDNG